MASTLLVPALVAGVLLVGASGPSPAGPRPVVVHPATNDDEATSAHAATNAGTTVRYVAPLPEPLQVLTPFDPPANPYGPGHLGVDLAAAPGEAVRSAGAGTVSFAGPVAGRGVVVIAHPDGISTEYEPVDPVVHAGVRVAAGTVVGDVDGRHEACAPASCLHWGARRGRTYLDPLDLLRPLGPVRLLPWTDGTQ